MKKPTTRVPVAMKKLAVTDKGKGWAGVTITDPELGLLTERFVEATHWRGPCELEFIRAADGSHHLIEINPRFPAWVYLAASAGMNLPRHAVEIAAGAPLHLQPAGDVAADVGPARTALHQGARHHRIEGRLRQIAGEPQPLGRHRRVAVPLPLHGAAEMVVEIGTQSLEPVFGDGDQAQSGAAPLLGVGGGERRAECKGREGAPDRAGGVLDDPGEDFQTVLGPTDARS